MTNEEYLNKKLIQSYEKINNLTDLLQKTETECLSHLKFTMQLVSIVRRGKQIDRELLFTLMKEHCLVENANEIIPFKVLQR